MRLMTLRMVRPLDAEVATSPSWWRTGEQWLAAPSSVLTEPGRLADRFLQRYPGLDDNGRAAASSGLIHSENPSDHERHAMSQA